MLDVRANFSVMLHDHFIMKTIWQQSKCKVSRMLKLKYNH